MTGDSQAVRRAPDWPRCGASAAIFREGAVLLIERAKGALKGRWSLPGGHIEPGETARRRPCARCCEETGVEADIHGLVDVHDVILRKEMARCSPTISSPYSVAAGVRASRPPAATLVQRASCESAISRATR